MTQLEQLKPLLDDIVADLTSKHVAKDLTSKYGVLHVRPCNDGYEIYNLRNKVKKDFWGKVIREYKVRGDYCIITTNALGGNRLFVDVTYSKHFPDLVKTLLVIKETRAAS